jgi:hypothetical protein
LLAALEASAEVAIVQAAGQSCPRNEISQNSGILSMAMRKWLWPTFGDAVVGVACGVTIAAFVIMAGVRS